MKKGGGIGPVKPWQPPLCGEHDGIGAKSNFEIIRKKISLVVTRSFLHSRTYYFDYEFNSRHIKKTYSRARWSYGDHDSTLPTG